MSKWKTVPASAVRPGDRVRLRGTEIEVTRIDVGFLGTAGFLAFVEDTAQRWIKLPSAPEGEVEVRVG